jgi:hypothetical protein
VKAVPADFDDSGLRRYLLGLLPEGEAEALEEAYLARPEVWERLRGIEDDLLDDYAGGRLGPADSAAFESRYLASSPLRDRVTAARALRLAAAPEAALGEARVVTARPARWGVLLALAAGLFLVGLAFWPRPPRAGQSTSASPTLTPVPRMETPMPPPPEPMKTPTAPALTATWEPLANPVVLALSPVLLRGEEQPVELQLPPETDTVVLELEGDPALLPSASALRASIKTVEGKQVWRGQARRANDALRPSLLASAHVPAARLAAGDYLVTLSTRGTSDGTVHSYFFRVGR